MHPRNPYHSPPDFDALAQAYPLLSTYVKGRSIDFHDEAAQRCLTQALLKRDFNLEVHLPPDRLCPPVPNRLNYILWIQDLVRALERAVPLVSRKTRCTIHGLDIGTGASAIYPLLACSLEPTWKFTATGTPVLVLPTLLFFSLNWATLELDDESYTNAAGNIRVNGLSERIRVVKVEGADVQDSVSEQLPHFGFNHLFSAGDSSGTSSVPTSPAPSTAPAAVPSNSTTPVQFTMCNPPFYSSTADVQDSEALKELGALGACTGVPVEMITPGGEARFVGEMVRESVSVSASSSGDSMDDEERMKKRRTGNDTVDSGVSLRSVSPGSEEGPRWYTSMLGKMGSVVEIVEVFRELGITNYAITEFVQGQTRRWAVGWCIGGWRLSDISLASHADALSTQDIARLPNPNPTLQRLLPPRNALRFDIRISNESDVHARLEGVLTGVVGAQVTRDEGPGPTGFVVSVARDTWSRNARRKRKREEVAHNEAPERDRLQAPALLCIIVLRQGDTGGGVDEVQMEMEVRWVYGKERSLLESFASHVARKFMRII
ncbi:hypothetical protein DXG01_002755 [Tephrocybe rancida]|nr:hypothetical protein DXG01_002755 [Tephrocybe rancida]